MSEVFGIPSKGMNSLKEAMFIEVLSALREHPSDSVRLAAERLKTELEEWTGGEVQGLFGQPWPSE